MSSSDFAALLIAVALLSYIHAVGPVEFINRVIVLFGMG